MACETRHCDASVMLEKVYPTVPRCCQDPVALQCRAGFTARSCTTQFTFSARLAPGSWHFSVR